MNRVRCLSYCVGLLVMGGCADEIGNDSVNSDDDASSSNGSELLDGGMDAGKDPFGNATTPARDAEIIAPDAFFINDPQPPMCGEDGVMHEGEQPGGSLQCPDDKNREGCPCPTAGMSAACWPGKRVNREHGICKDGVTTCVETPEFGLRWSACEGYVLPQEDAVTGKEACGCFSSGTWTLNNLAPCISQSQSGEMYLYSSKLKADGTLDCGTNITGVPPLPDMPWSTSQVNIDCAGQFELCYTIRAGDIEHPSPEDCVIMQLCQETWYPEEGVDLALDALPAWSSSATECAAQFVESGGYGEMSVFGKSIECDVVDDGEGNPYVFSRTDYCPPSCGSTPELEECMHCSTGGSGMFNP